MNGLQDKRQERDTLSTLVMNSFTFTLDSLFQRSFLNHNEEADERTRNKTGRRWEIRLNAWHTREILDDSPWFFSWFRLKSLPNSLWDCILLFICLSLPWVGLSFFPISLVIVCILSQETKSVTDKQKASQWLERYFGNFSSLRN